MQSEYMMIILFSEAMVYNYGWKIGRVICNFQSFNTLGIYVKHFLHGKQFRLNAELVFGHPTMTADFKGIGQSNEYSLSPRAEKWSHLPQRIAQIIFPWVEASGL